MRVKEEAVEAPRFSTGLERSGTRFFSCSKDQKSLDFSADSPNVIIGNGRAVSGFEFHLFDRLQQINQQV